MAKAPGRCCAKGARIIVNVAWEPQPWQAAFIACPVEEVFGGGSRGGGKTDGVLGDWLNHADQYKENAIGLMVRRTATELVETQERARVILSKIGARFTYRPARVIMPGGGRLTFAYLDRDADAENYQGASFCVAVGTSIRMADGTLRAIEAIKIGDMVATLEGPRPVTGTTRPYLTACVRVLVRAASGEYLGNQIHPVSHPVLTTAGLTCERTHQIRRIVSRCPPMTSSRSVADATPLPCVDPEIPAWFAYSLCEKIDYKVSLDAPLRFSLPQQRSVPVVLHVRSRRSGQQRDHGSRGITILYRSHDISGPSIRSLSQDRTWECLDQPRPDGLARLARGLDGLSQPSGPADGQPGWHRDAGSQSGCHSEHDFDDGPALADPESGRGWLPSPGDAASPSHTGRMGGLGTTHRYNPPEQLWWEHPYTGEARHLSEAVTHGTMEFVEYVTASVADLTVESANQYISDTGLVNKNTRVYVEEVGNFPSPTPILKLMATLPSGAGIPVGMRLTGNPGGSGHQWVKARYIDPAPRGWRVITDPETGSERIYLPSRIAQNKYLGEDYVRRLRGVGTPELVKAWLEGDWNVIAGAFFSEFSADRHIIAPRALPEHWARFRSFDWGSARPFAVHWWAVSDGTLSDIARGCLVCYREWYGMKPGEPNVGLHMTAEQVAEGIRDRERDDPKPKDGGFVGVADPSIFAEDGGPSIAARMTRAARIVFRPGDNKRVPQRGAMGGWDQVRARLVGDADGKPMVVFFSTCRDLIRTLPALQHDPSRAEDCDSEGEDHAPDSCRYAMMSRPFIREAERQRPRDSWDAAFNRDEGEVRDWRTV